MEFITDNLIWFIIGGIVLLMTIIGFIAEQTDFGRKNFEKKVKTEKPKKVKKEQNKEIKEENITLEATEPVPVVEENQIVDNVALEPAIDFENVTQENVSNSVINEPTLEELSVPLESENSDLVQPVVIEEELNETYENQNDSFVAVQPEDLKLPELDTIENTNSVAEDDDIWKF